MTDINAAAERLRMILEGSEWSEIYPHEEGERVPDYLFEQYLDLSTIRDAYLAEHDPTLADQAWLWKVSGGDSGCCRDERRYELGEAIRVYGWAVPGPQCWVFSMHVGMHKVCDNPTRGDVRSLCRVLGIKLSETKGGEQ